MKIILANETCDAGSGDYAGKSDGRPGLRETCGKKSGNMRARFASIHADKNVGGGMLSEQVGRESAAGGKKSGVVQRGRAGDAADAIRSEKFFGHERLTFSS